MTFTVDLDRTMTLTVSAELTPAYYGAFPALPDLGWYTGLDLKSAGQVEGSAVYLYDWSRSYFYDELLEQVALYCQLIRQEGFAYLGGQGDAVHFRGEGLDVVIGLDGTNLYADVRRL